MNRDCEHFVEQLADTLGTGPTVTMPPELVRHLAACPDCRRLFDDARAGLAAIRDLPEPDERIFHIGGGRRGGTIVRSAHPAQSPRAAILRYAAVILLAFSSGFFARAWIGPTDAPARGGPGVRVVETLSGEAGSDSLRDALMRAHRRNPGTSDLAKLLMAVAPSRR